MLWAKGQSGNPSGRPRVSKAVKQRLAIAPLDNFEGGSNAVRAALADGLFERVECLGCQIAQTLLDGP